MTAVGWTANLCVRTPFFSNSSRRTRTLSPHSVARLIHRYVAPAFMAVIAIMVGVGGHQSEASAARPPSEDAARGRPRIDDSLGYRILLSDRGTLLRGVALSFDGGDPYGAREKTIPPIESFEKLKTVYGMNAVHVYLEGNASDNPEPAGHNLAIADKLVEITRQTGLYLVITIGCNGENGSIHSMQKALDFWSLYADRYQDETHVVFEAHNEPVHLTLDNATREDWDKQAELYRHIRRLAPRSMILLGSFMSFHHPDGKDTEGTDYLASKGVRWNNCALAFHGYWDPMRIERTIAAFQSHPRHPALFCTEFNQYDTARDFNSRCESHHIGWLQFEWFESDHNLIGFRGRADKSGTIWRPDSPKAIWPTLGTPDIPGPDVEFSLLNRDKGRYLRIADQELVADVDLEEVKGDQREFFTVETLDDGLVAIRTSTGRYLSVQSEGKPIVATRRRISETEKFEWLQLPTGDVALRPWNANGHLLGVLKTGPSEGRVSACRHGALVNGDATFLVVTDPDPTYLPESIVAFNNRVPKVPGTTPIRAVDFDHGGEGVAINDSDGDDIGDMHRRDDGADIELTDDGRPFIGWFTGGEWLTYTVDVERTGTYDFIFRLAVGGDPGSLHVEIDGRNLTGRIERSHTGGWRSFVDVRRDGIELTEGRHQLKVVSGGGINLMSITIE